MASSYLGPESPPPLSVISEMYQDRLLLPFYGENEIYTFGDAYETKLLSLINRYLGLGTTDRLCFIGDDVDCLMPVIEDRFCLLNPATSLIPGVFHYAQTETRKVIPIRISHMGAEDFFRQNSEQCGISGPIFDHIIVRESVRYFENTVETFSNMAKCCRHDGKILIIHRPGPLNTLPLFKNARERIKENDVTYDSVLKDLQSCRFDVQWEMQYLPIRLPKTKWLKMLKEKYPSQMRVISATEVESGVRELTEGVLKYEGDTVEFVDRLIFMTASQPILQQSYPSLQKFAKPPTKSENVLRFTMPVTETVRKYLKSS